MPSSPAAAQCNATAAIPVLGGEMNALAVSYTITAADFVGTLVFFGFFLYMRGRVRRLAQRIDDDNITPSDYTVWVSGVPRDTTELEIATHMSELFGLVVAEEDHAQQAQQQQRGGSFSPKGSDAAKDKVRGPPSKLQTKSSTRRTLDKSLSGKANQPAPLGSVLVALPNVDVEAVQDVSHTPLKQCVRLRAPPAPPCGSLIAPPPAFAGCGAHGLPTWRWCTPWARRCASI